MSSSSQEFQPFRLEDWWATGPLTADLKRKACRGATGWLSAHMTDDGLPVVDTAPESLLSRRGAQLRSFLAEHAIGHFLIEKGDRVYAHPVDVVDNLLNAGFSIDLRLHGYANGGGGLLPYGVELVPAVEERQLADGQLQVRFYDPRPGGW